LNAGWQQNGHGIGWTEMVAVYMAVATLISNKLTDMSIIGFTNNAGVHGALKAGYSHRSLQNEVLREIVHVMQEKQVWLSWEWIPSKENLADEPSCGIFPPRKLISTHPPLVPCFL
jgi:hypothetical protein